MPQVLVTALQHSDYYDTRTKTRFNPTVVRLPEGGAVYRAQAVVDEDVAKEFFADRPGIFKLESFTPATVAPFVPNEAVKLPSPDESKPAPVATDEAPAEAAPAIPTPDPKPAKKGR